MLFDELQNGKRLQDPEERVAKKLTRKSPSKNNIKSKSSSVSPMTYKITMVTISLIGIAAVLSVIGYIAYQGIKFFIGM